MICFHIYTDFIKKRLRFIRHSLSIYYIIKVYTKYNETL